MKNAPLLTADEVAEYLSVPKETLYRWNYHQTGPRPIKVGRYLRYRREDIQEWLDAQTLRQAYAG